MYTLFPAPAASVNVPMRLSPLNMPSAKPMVALNAVKFPVVERVRYLQVQRPGAPTATFIVPKFRFSKYPLILAANIATSRVVNVMLTLLVAVIPAVPPQAITTGTDVAVGLISNVPITPFVQVKLVRVEKFKFLVCIYPEL